MAENKGEPLAPLTTSPSNSQPSSPRRRTSSGATATGRLRSASNKFIDSNMPLGFMAATGNAAANAPSLADFRRTSQGGRRDSNSSLPRSNTASPSSPEFQLSPTKTRPDRARTGSSGKLDMISGEDDDGDGFPANIFGRGELNDQSFVRGQRASQVGTRVPKLAVRNREATEKKAEDQASEGALAVDLGPSLSVPSQSNEASGDTKVGKSKEAFPDFEDDDDDLDDLLPKPRRSSKNIDAMLGRSPAAGPSTSKSVSTKVPKGDAAEDEDFKDASSHLDLDGDLAGFDDVLPRPKRSSKNIDAMLGRTPEKVGSPPSYEDKADEEHPNPLPNDDGVYPNGYTFPPKKTWGQATAAGSKAFLRFTFTPLGFAVVLYGLNVVAWGGMLFLLLCNASPWMCQNGDGTYDCNNINSPRRVWVEIDSQILNSLFCVTGFGLIPWRFRDFYYLMKWRAGKNYDGLRKLAGYHNGWFRLPDSDNLPIRPYNESDLYEDEINRALPLPLKRTPAPPLTGARAPPTALWKMDYVIWAFMWNTFLQAVLSAFMWGLNRYDRPSWSTGLFVALACIVAALGGLMQFTEGKRIKKVEGIPIDGEETVRDVENRQRDIPNSEKREGETESEASKAKQTAKG